MDPEQAIAAAAGGGLVKQHSGAEDVGITQGGGAGRRLNGTEMTGTLSDGALAGSGGNAGHFPGGLCGLRRNQPQLRSSGP